MHSKSMKSLLAVISLILFAVCMEADVWARSTRSSSSRSSISRSSTRSSTRTQRSSTKSYSKPTTQKPKASTQKPSAAKPKQAAPKQAEAPTSVRPATQKSAAKNISETKSTATPKSTVTTPRESTQQRQKNAAMSSAQKSTAVSTKNMTSAQVRNVKAQQRKYSRDLKAENRQLKRKVRVAERQTARARREAREAQNRVDPTVVYVNSGYGLSNTLWTMAAISAFGNMYHGIHFHDHYNHALHHSWLWHYHHPNYDTTHWSDERRAEHQQWNDYYEGQGVERNQNYVDPGTNKDEDFIESYVEANPDEFYGAAAEEVTVTSLPDESTVPEMLAAGSVIPQQQKVKHEVTVKKKTSGATWAALIIGVVLLAGIIALVMYNKGYF